MSLTDLTIFVVATFVSVLGTLYLIVDLYLRKTQGKYFVPFIAADSYGISKMIEVLNLNGDEIVIDVGSGWGSILFGVVKRYPKITAVGVEINPLVNLFAKIRRVVFYTKRNMTFINQDACKLDYTPFNVVFVFMLTAFLNQKLLPKLEKELQVGTLIVSYVFRIKSVYFTEQEIDLPVTGWKKKIYLYRKIR